MSDVNTTPLIDVMASAARNDMTRMGFTNIAQYAD